MKPAEEIFPVEVFAGTSLQAGMLKSMLEDAGIEAFLKDDILGTLSPWWVAPGGAGSVKVVVSNLDFDKALIVVNHFENNLRNPS